MSPAKLPKPCNFPGCSALVIGSRCCPEHARHTDHYRQATQKFYTSTTWRRLRLLVLADNPLCVQCKAPATVVDHIKPIAEGGSSSDMNNLQSMCDKCHNQKRQKESVTRRYF